MLESICLPKMTGITDYIIKEHWIAFINRPEPFLIKSNAFSIKALHYTQVIS